MVDETGDTVNPLVAGPFHYLSGFRNPLNKVLEAKPPSESAKFGD